MADISDLFSANVQYRYRPYDKPIVGRDAVVASWLGKTFRPTAISPAIHECENPAPPAD